MESQIRLIKQYYIPILIALGSEVLILVFISRLATYIIPNSRAATLDIWQLWNVWDAPHYISVASSGYQKVGDAANFIVLLPLFPFLIFVFKYIFQTSFLFSGYIVSFISTVLLAIILYKLTLLDYPKKTAVLAVLMLFIFPTAFFLHIPYTEALFILLSVASFYFVRVKRYWVGFLFVSLATATKVAGLVLLPALLAEILIYHRQSFAKKTIYNRLSILLFGSVLITGGFLVYLLLNYSLWGNFFYFTIIQKQHFYENFAPLGQGLISTFQSLSWRVGLEKIMLGYAQIIAFILALLTSIYALVKIRVSYGIFMLASLFFSYSMSFWACMPRYILPLFPMFIVLALFSNNLIFRYLWILVSSLLLIIFSLIFIQYGPVL